MRVKVFTIAISSAFFVLIGGLWYIQVVKGPTYEKLSEQNRIRLIPLRAPRGVIYDRNGEILAGNRLSFDAVIIPQESKDLDRTIDMLSAILQLSPHHLHQDFRRGYSAPFAPVVVGRDIDKRRAFVLEERSFDLPGVVTQIKPIRYYPHKETCSHLVGYLGEIDPIELEKLKEYGYKMRDAIGKFGIEQSFDHVLRGVDGGVQIEVNNMGRQVKVLGNREPVGGKDVWLNIDIELQEFLHRLLSEWCGAATVMNPKNGEILAMVSMPGYDPNIFIDPKRNSEIKRVMTLEQAPMVNRVISGRYPPGSIFKVVTAAAGLETKTITRTSTFPCHGTYQVGDQDFFCWDRDGHLQQNVQEALAHSCNIFFYHLGIMVGPNKLASFAKQFGLGKPTKVELWGEFEGLVPTKQWKRLKMREAWWDGETAHFAIGQGYLLMTPLQAVRMISAVGNGGYLVEPHLIKKIGDMQLRHQATRIKISEETLTIIKDGLRKVVVEPSGTGHRAYLPEVGIAAKTGTAQIVGKKSHAWFVGFSPIENPQISFAIILEHEGSGGGIPAEIAKELVKFYVKL